MTIRIPRGVLLTLAGVVMLAGVGVGTFFVGRATIDQDAIRDRGRSEIEAQYREGASGYQRIYELAHREGRRAGRRAGKRVGLARGQEAGYTQGLDEGLTAGENYAFDGYPGGWKIGHWYVVLIGPGEGGSRYSIDSRYSMEPYESYNLCPDDSGSICGDSF